MRFSKLYETYQDWLGHYLNRPPNRYGIRIWSYHQSHPEGTLAEARGHKPKAPSPAIFLEPSLTPEEKVPLIMFRTTFVLKLPVSHRYKVMRRHVWSEEPINVDAALDRFLEDCGAYVHSKAYAAENEGEVGIEDNEELPRNDLDLARGEEDDFYDAGGS